MKSHPNHHCWRRSWRLLHNTLSTMLCPFWRVLLVLALLFSVLPFPVAAQTEETTSLPRTHTVYPGQSLSQIAVLYGVSMEDLMRANDLEDADTIVIGQVLRIPDQETPVPPTPETSTRATPEPDIGHPAIEIEPRAVVNEPPATHTVQAGETLSEIAKQYGISQAELMDLNGIVNPDTIVVGQRLRLTPALNTEIAQEPEPDTARVDEDETSTQPSTTSLITSRNQVYYVESGDNITSIALRFGVDEEALRQINRLTDEDIGRLSIGQPLILPATERELKMERPTPTSQQSEYTVQQGDSLGSIAQANGLILAELLDANFLANPDAIYVGQRLVLPEPIEENAEEENAAEENQPERIAHPRTGFYYYTVKQGDTLSELARDFNTTVLAILEYNNLPNAETLYRDLGLRIPYGPPPLRERRPPVPQSGTSFMVSLSRQQCWVFQGDRVLHSWVCSTGYGEWITRTGVFFVQTKLEMAQSRAYELDMPYWLGIYDVGPAENGIHGLPIDWETNEKIWEGLIGQPATFGCAMLRDEDAATLFDLAYLGMPIYIVQ